MENKYFYHDGKTLFSKVQGKKLATVEQNYYDDLGREENVKLIEQGALIKKKIGSLVVIKFFNNDGTQLFSVNSRDCKEYIYDINAYPLKSGIVLSYSMEKDKFYEYRTFDGKEFSSLLMADLVEKIKEIDDIKTEKSSTQQKTEPVLTKFLFSCLGQKIEENDENNEENQQIL